MIANDTNSYENTRETAGQTGVYKLNTGKKLRNKVCKGRAQVQVRRDRSKEV